MENSRQGSFIKLIGPGELEKVREKLSSYQRICITGASGWLGKETADLLRSALGTDFEHKVTLVSSDGREIQLFSGIYKSTSWKDFVSGPSFDLIIHFAFLSPGNIARLGVDTYIELNREIISNLLTVASKNPHGTLLTASSGAASSYRSDLGSTVPYEIYSGIKNEMENRVTQSETFKYVGIMRIWNVSGIYLDLDSPYALSSFVDQGLRSAVIEVKGAPESLRTYVNAQEMMWVYLMSLGMLNRKPIDSGGFSASLIELADLVADSLRDRKVSVGNASKNSPVSVYSPNPAEFNSLADLYSIKLSNLDEQVKMVLKMCSR